MVQSSGPFFSNDLEGFLKVVGLFGALLGSLIALVVRLTQSKLVGRINGQARDLTGLGEKFDRMEHQRTATDAELNRQNIVLNQHTLQLAEQARRQGSLETSVENMIRGQTGMQTDITGLIIEQGRIMTEKLTKIEIEVARLQERDRLADQLEKLGRRA